MSNRIAAACLGLMMTLSFNQPTAAAGLTSLPSTQDIEIQIEKLDSQIINTMQIISVNEVKIKEIQTEVEKTKVGIAESEKALTLQEERFRLEASAMYSNKMTSYWGILLSSPDLKTFFSRVGTANALIEHDKIIMESYRTEQTNLTMKQEKLTEETNQIAILISDNKVKLEALNKDKAEAVILAQGIAASATSTLGIANADLTNQVVAYATTFLGVPYEWGGNGPSTFDCSGYMVYVANHFGKSIPRTAAEQQKVGVSVCYENLQPGDLVFFGSPAHHVGMYVGNGNYIHAPKTGDVIKISSLASRSDFSGARRIY